MSETTAPCVFVTAIYNIQDPERVAYHDVLWTLVRTLADSLPHLHIVCSAADAEKCTDMPNITKHYVEFSDLRTYSLLKTARRLPATARPTKDTLEYMIVQNAKIECIQRVCAAGIEGQNYAWLDAGLAKLCKTPEATIRTFVERITSGIIPPEYQNHVIFPGCWAPCQDMSHLSERIAWRFCGSVCIVPAELVEPFAIEHLRGCTEFLEKTGTATWEINVWAYIEPRLPVIWVYGEHNDRILDCFGSIWRPRE